MWIQTTEHEAFNTDQLQAISVDEDAQSKQPCLSGVEPDGNASFVMAIFETEDEAQAAFGKVMSGLQADKFLCDLTA